MVGNGGIHLNPAHTGRPEFPGYSSLHSEFLSQTKKTKGHFTVYSADFLISR